MVTKRPMWWLTLAALICLLGVIAQGYGGGGLAAAQDDDGEDDRLDPFEVRAMDSAGSGFEMQRITFYDSLGFDIPRFGLYAVFDAGFFKEVETALPCINASDIRLLLDGREYAPQRDPMMTMKEFYGDVRDFPGVFDAQCIEDMSGDLTFFVFDVPPTAGSVGMRFKNGESDMDIDWQFAPGDTVLFRFGVALLDQAELIATADAMVADEPVDELTALLLDASDEIVEVIVTTTGPRENLFYAEIFVTEGSVTEATAAALLDAVQESMPGLLEYSVILDDGIAAADFIVQPGEEMRITPLTTFMTVRNAQQGATATPRPIPASTTVRYITAQANGRSCPETSCEIVNVFSPGDQVAVIRPEVGEAVGGNTTWYAVGFEGQWIYVHSSLIGATPPRPTQPAAAPPPPGNSNTGRRPANCDEAVAMGLSPEEAAQWPHLDRDKDGVACYGD